METAEKLITENLDIWTSAVKAKSSAGRGASKKRELYGIKKVRELILELAVNGTLVPQIPDDEPASAQLKRIAVAQSKNGRTKKKSKSITSSALSEIDSKKLPTGWENTSLESLLTVINGRAYKKAELLESGMPVLRVGNLFTSSHWYYSDLDLEDDKYCESGDLIYAWSASFGPFIWDGPKAIYHYHIWKLLPHSEENISKEFLFWFLQEKTQEIKNAGRGLAMLHMTKGRMEKLAVRLPPLAEQHRIVAKVDELMALCDQLEQEQESSLDKHDTLVATLLGALTTATADASQFAQAWQRIQANFDTLFTTESSIDQLKQTILQLAVMGKLVEQDPEDEPAGTLLRRIASEQNPLSTSKSRKKNVQAAETLERFNLPESWEWCKVWEVAELITSGSRDWAKHYSDSGPIFVTMGNLSRGDYKLRMDTIRHVQPPRSSEGARTKLQKGDLLISITGDVGNLGLIPKGFGEAYINQHTCLLRFVPECRNRYFAELLRSPWSKYQFDAPQRGIKNSFRLPDLGEMLIPVPPLAEQHRIVAKVDELMALCDQLKASLATAQATQLNLADSLVEQAIG